MRQLVKCACRCGAVLGGVIEPPSASPVVIDDNVLIGANAVILEGVHVGEGAIVARVQLLLKMFRGAVVAVPLLK